MIGQCPPKYVGVHVLQHCCDSDEMRAFVGLHCNSCVVMHGLENKNKEIFLHLPVTSYLKGQNVYVIIWFMNTISVCI